MRAPAEVVCSQKWSDVGEGGKVAAKHQRNASMPLANCGFFRTLNSVLNSVLPVGLREGIVSACNDQRREAQAAR